MQTKSGNTRPATSFWRNNGLSIVLFLLFTGTLLGQIVAGWLDDNHERVLHGQTAAPLFDYLQSGHFLEVTMENWESEFLQMFVFIVFTVFLFQRGSAESKDPDEPEQNRQLTALSPGPVHVGGWRLKLYENSLSLAFLFVFLVTFFLHAVGGAKQYSEELVSHGGHPISALAYLCSSRFWFESLQNWQSEFLSLWAMVVGSIYLRQRGSAESKAVEAPHSETG